MNETVKNESDGGQIGVQTAEILLNREDQWVYLAVGLVTLVIAAGCVGNVMVLLAVRKVKKLQTVSNMFVMNLSVCDLLSVLCVLPFNIYTYIADGWFIATSLCKIIGFLGYTLTGTTIITITLIAYNRCKLVLDPGGYKTLYTNRNITIMLVISWFVPVLCLVPALTGVWGNFGYVAMMVSCNLLLDHKNQLFKIFLMIVRAVIPCVLIVYYYVRIYHTTLRSHHRLKQKSRQLSSLGIHKQRLEMRMTRMMLIIFIVFALSYFPCTITGIVDWNTILSKQFHMFCQLSVCIGSAINPLIYGLMNLQFRNAYIRICCLKKLSETKLTSKTLNRI
ncbi:G-protein coupled receptor moody-like [Mytilus edulis]|uniref:G-protein coupled receptor moody-like n=1 Tax=Mytilus edulis TaxID=6550 RepID=UPI0039F0DF46